MQRRTMVWRELNCQAKPRETLDEGLAGVECGSEEGDGKQALIRSLCEHTERTA